MGERKGGEMRNKTAGVNDASSSHFFFFHFFPTFHFFTLLVAPSSSLLLPPRLSSFLDPLFSSSSMASRRIV